MSLICPQCGKDFTQGIIKVQTFTDAVIFRFGEAVDGIYRQRIRGPLDPEKIKSRIKSALGEDSRVVGKKLCEHLEASVGHQYLEELGLAFTPDEHCQWPALLYSDRFVLSEATAQCLVYACLAIDKAEEGLFLPSCPDGSDWTVSDDLPGRLWELRKKVGRQPGN